MELWGAVGAIATVVAAVVAAIAAWLARSSADHANAAAGTLARIEQDRRHAELRPSFKLETTEFNPGSDDLKLRLTLVGPAELDALDSLLVSIRNDDYRRGEVAPIAGEASEDDIRNHIWGPYRFRPSTGPYEATADKSGRTTSYDVPLPVGEHLDFVLEPTPPPWWSPWNAKQWAAVRGTTMKVEIVASHRALGMWTVRDSVETTASTGAEA